MAALAQNRAMVGLADELCRLNHILRCFDLHTGKHFRFRNVGGQNRCQRQQIPFQRVDGAERFPVGTIAVLGGDVSQGPEGGKVLAPDDT